MIIFIVRYGVLVEKNVKISITVPEDQKDRWKTEAEKRGQTLPGFIRYCVECFLVATRRKK